MSLIVQKYGGTSVGDIKKIALVADKVIREKGNGNDIVVVVSAMSGETNRLISLAKEIDSNISGRELDVDVIITSYSWIIFDKLFKFEYLQSFSMASFFPFSSFLLQIVISLTLLDFKYFSASSVISPAPISKHFFSSTAENIFFIKRIDVYMNDIAFPPISVLVLTFLATEKEYSKSLFNFPSMDLLSRAIL